MNEYNYVEIEKLCTDIQIKVRNSRFRQNEKKDQTEDALEILKFPTLENRRFLVKEQDDLRM